MMKLFLLLTLITTSVFAKSDKGPCRFDLVGPATLPDSIMESKPMNVQECSQAAYKLLEQNKEHYNKALVKNFKTGTITIVELKD